uniref:ZP domain-containing protein n=1 Tax=Panagrellus redivivus TaxID=6233 RepID=A0A7E4VZ23_PANRE
MCHPSIYFKQKPPPSRAFIHPHATHHDEIRKPARCTEAICAYDVVVVLREAATSFAAAWFHLVDWILIMANHQMLRISSVLVALTVFTLTNAIPIPNGQVGRSEVECGEESIDVVFLTEDVFKGRVFVVGHANETDCVSREVGRRTTSISIRRDRCGVVTTRSNDPPGLFVNVKIMISFHEEFITKVDRGYEISCFFMEADKTVTYPITVSMASLQPFTELAEMPRCRYEVVDPFTKEPLSVVSVGAKLLHQWTCDSSAPNLWCMTVHSCFIEDGSGTEFNILTDEGCAIDRFLLDNLEYGPNPLMAQKEAHAIKFADRVVVNFQCSIRLDIKDGECPIPQCPDLKNQQKAAIKRRSLEDKQRAETVGIFDLDVRAGMNVMDPDLDLGGLEKEAAAATSTAEASCVPLTSLVLPAATAISLIMCLLTVVVYLSLRSRSVELKQ